MRQQVALCVDELTLQRPGLMGLEGENLEAQSWLSVFTTGEEARRAVNGEEAPAEAWVHSSEDVDPINLAATLKADRPAMPVKLVVGEGSGSLYSRAGSASIDEVLDADGFARCYYEAKIEAGTSREGTGAGPASALALQGGAGALLEADWELELEHPKLESALPLTVAEGSPKLAHAANRSRGFIMPVLSGSGGAGKSSVAVLSALIARDMGYKTLLLDYDLQFGDVALMTGMEAPLTIDRAIADPAKLAAEEARDPMLTVLAAPERLEQSEEIVALMPRFLDEVVGCYDAVITNTGAAWAEQHAALLERSYVSLFLIDQRASSIRACKHALELCARCGIATGPLEFALNRCGKGAPLTSADVSGALKGAAVYELRDGGRDVEDYLGSGAAADLLASGNEFCESLKQVIGKLLPGGSALPGEAAGGPEGKRGMLRRGRHAGRKRGRRS